MQQQRDNSSSARKNHSNIVPQKENDNSPETKLKVMEYYDLTDREFKKAVMKKHNELQASSERQFSELRNKMKEQKEYFTKETETLKKNQTEIMELKKSINKMENTMKSTGNRADHMEERISVSKTEI